MIFFRWVLFIYFGLRDVFFWGWRGICMLVSSLLENVCLLGVCDLDIRFLLQFFFVVVVRVVFVFLGFFLEIGEIVFVEFFLLIFYGRFMRSTILSFLLYRVFFVCCSLGGYFLVNRQSLKDFVGVLGQRNGGCGLCLIFCKGGMGCQFRRMCSWRVEYFF